MHENECLCVLLVQAVLSPYTSATVYVFAVAVFLVVALVKHVPSVPPIEWR